jgi:iron complex outermembrane recepter protein
LNSATQYRHRNWVRSALSLSIAAICAQAGLTNALAQTANPDPATLDKITVTGTRIRSANITSTSPVSQLGAEDIQTMRAVTVEDFSTKLPQFGGGVSSTSAGSDAFGAQTLDLRNLGQSRTLVLINGTRAVPFSFRNAVDVNFVPAPLLRRVDVLTGGAAAVYGADAIAGVVNFIINDNFRGLQVGGNYRSGSGGGSQAGVNLTGGWSLGGRGSFVGYLEYTDRKELLAGERDWALARPVLSPGAGGNFTDVASGNKFSFDQTGALTTTAQTTDYTPKYFLVQPMQRLNASGFFKYDLTNSIQGYGRYMYSNVKTTGAPRSGQAPAVINGNYSISSTNPFLTTDIRNRLTFVNGNANVTISRSLSELGVITAENDRDTQQLQIGVRGPITDNINWDVYAQFGRSAESVEVIGDGLRANFNNTLVNSVNLFGPGADLSSLAQPFKYGDRTRKQNVFAGTVSGDSTGLFKLPAGPLGFALGVEARREKAVFDYNPGLSTSFRQGVETGPAVPPFFNANEIYAELLVPILANLPGVKNLSLEAAYRNSSYKKSVGSSNSYGTNKIGLSWAITDDIRLRATSQSVIREPNFGEFANPVGSIPFANLVNVARLRPRYQGDPCVLGTGNAEQCARFKAPAVGSYNSLDAANLTGGYFFGGNPDIQAEKGKTRTFGLVVAPKAVPGLSVAIDAYSIVLNDAVGQIQPVDALTSCYITDPSANNPLCAAVTRDPVTGRIKDGFPVDRNLATIKQKGIDIDLGYRVALNASWAKQLALGYQAAIVRSYSIQRNAVLDPIDCKGTYGSRCSTDSTSLVQPAYRHRVTAGMTFGDVSTQLAWKRIGKVVDSTVGSTESIAAQNYLDLNFGYEPQILKGLKLNFGIDNITNKKPPTVTNSSTFNTYADSYPVLGRSYGLTGSYKF